MNPYYQIINEARRMVFSQRDGLYNVILTITGGALILSLSFVERFGKNPSYIHLLKLSWIFLVTAILANVLMRYFFNEASLVETNKAQFQIDNPNQPIEEFFKRYKPELKFTIPAWICFFFFWLSFLAGMIVLLIFALKSS